MTKEPLEQLETIFDQSVLVDADKMSGIYFLFFDDELVYVGQSKCIILRLGSHVRGRPFLFNRMAFIHCPENQLDELEARYIKEFRPPENKKMPTGVAPRAPLKPRKRPTPPPGRLVDKAYLRRAEAALHLTALGYPISRNTLAELPKRGGGPPHVKFRGIAVYEREKLEAWVHSTPQIKTA